MLFSTVLPPETSCQAKQAYTAACQTILETCGANHGHMYHSDDSEWEEEVVDKLASAFVSLADILCHAGCVSHSTLLSLFHSVLTVSLDSLLEYLTNRRCVDPASTCITRSTDDAFTLYPDILVPFS
jgi:3-dehydroquinate dehydratase